MARTKGAKALTVNQHGLSARQAMRHLGIQARCHKLLLKLVEEGNLVCYRKGHNWRRYHIADLDAIRTYARSRVHWKCLL